MDDILWLWFLTAVNGKKCMRMVCEQSLFLLFHQSLCAGCISAQEWMSERLREQARKSPVAWKFLTSTW